MSEEKAKVSISSRLLGFVQEARFIIMVIGVALIVAVIAILIVNQINSNRLADATSLSDRLATLQSDWESTPDDAKKSSIRAEFIAQRNKIIAAYPSSYYHQRAIYLDASMLYASKSYEEAEKAFISACDIKKDSYLASVCLFNASASAESGQHLDRALTILQRLVKDYKDTGCEVPRALFNIGRLLEANNAFKDAVASYQRIVDEYPSSDWTKFARDRIIVLKTEQKV